VIRLQQRFFTCLPHSISQDQTSVHPRKFSCKSLLLKILHVSHLGSRFFGRSPVFSIFYGGTGGGGWAGRSQFSTASGSLDSRPVEEKKQIPRRLKPARDDKNEGLGRGAEAPHYPNHRLHRLLRQPEKPARDYKVREFAKAQLKLCPFKSHRSGKGDHSFQGEHGLVFRYRAELLPVKMTRPRGIFALIALSMSLAISLGALNTNSPDPASTAKSSAAGNPDILFVNADIYTQASPARAEAMAVRDGRILAIGSNADIRKLKGIRTQVVDLGGHFVMPGYNDAHVHLAAGGFRHYEVDLTGAQSLQEMQQQIAAHTKLLAPGEWIIGGGWDHTLWVGEQLPTRQDLDSVTGDHPAFLGRVDGHISIANTAALKAAGITASTPDPPGGKIDHDAQGQPTGIIREDPAMTLVWSRIPAHTPSQRRRAAEYALTNAAMWGITSAQDYSTWEDFLTYEEMERDGKLPIRISEWLDFNNSVELLEKHRALHPADDPMLHTAMLKGFMDGSLGSRTAALLAPFSDDPGNSGLPRYQQSQLNRMAVERAAAGFQLGFHAIGDRATQMALDAYAEAERSARENNWSRDFRFRIEHAQVIAPGQFQQFKELGVIASVQPNHLLTDMHWAVERIGPERAKTSYPWKQFLDDGIPLAFGTDYPVEPITPFRGIYAAVTRKNEAGTKEYFPQQKISIEQALAAYTTGAAYAQFAEKEKGTLAPGMLADFVVLDRDLTKIPQPEILKTQVLRTVVGGKTVYQAGRP
jgi:predicted amidohydrolase YtcJ